MKYFQNPNGKVYGYDDTDPTQTPYIEAAIADGMEDITGQWPLADVIQPSQSIILQIAALEVKQTARMAREALIQAKNIFVSGEFAGLTSLEAYIKIDTQIGALREQLKGLSNE